jgi:hypothetical protein
LPGPGTSFKNGFSLNTEIDFPFFLYFSISKTVGIVYDAGDGLRTGIGLNLYPVPNGLLLVYFFGGSGISLNLSSIIFYI